MTVSANLNRPVPPSRREFLNYAFGASVALATAASCGGLAWFLQQQRFVGSANSGLFRLDAGELPIPQGSPIFVREAQVYISNLDDGLVALFAQCTYDRYLVRWSHTNWRFECPACGSKYRLDGVYIELDAPRDLDRAVLQVSTDHGVLTTPADGSPVSPEGAQSVVLDVQQRIPGNPSIHVDLPQP